ncbi:MAG TPA: penicillin acylase family protein [Thermoanaerobaculia bacterium]|nr:penicillin acylase family protein [Thermoanaerobaculia bacterium]
MRLPVALAMLVATLLAACAESPAPAPQTPEEMAAAVTIVRDEWGVPHVYGPTDESVVFGYMVAQAEDNFWQIEDSIIHALGRSAEVQGEAGVAGDLLNRALEIVPLSLAEWERTDPEIRSLCEAAAAGLNWFLATHPEVQPRLITEFEPWHTIAFSRFAVYQLFVFGRAGIRGEEMAGLATPLQRAAHFAPPDFEAWLADREGSLAAQGEAAAGSNMWAVRPERTDDGHAYLFINPHQPYFGSGQWYEGHVQSDEGLHFSGAGFFGSLLPTIGHNEHLGWSHTVNEPDILDVFLETFDQEGEPLAYRYGDGYRTATAWVEEVTVKTDAGLETREYELTKTHHGPIVGHRDGKALAVKMAMFEEGGQVAQRYAMARAQSFDEFKAAMATLATPMFNTVYADVEGNIWYAYYGAVPRRDPSYDWSQPVDGSDPGTEWQGYHPLDELPQVLNPAAGYVQNCNATPFLATGGDDNPDPAAFPPYMVNEDDNPRSQISRRILESEESFSWEEWQRYAFDTTVLEAETWVPKLRAALDAALDGQGAVANPAQVKKLLPAVERLEAWDRVATIEGPEMTLFVGFREQMISFRVEDPLEALERTLDGLEESWGTWEVAWGELNRVQRRHTSGTEPFSDEVASLPIAGGPGPVGIVYNFYTRPSKDTKRRYGVAGHSFVSVVDFGEPLRARSALVFGQSHDPASPHWFDQATLFSERRFKDAWFERAEVEAHARAAYAPGEAAPGEAGAAAADAPTAAGDG